MAVSEKYLMIVTTCPDMPAAEKIADVLVEKSLAACVQIIPGIKSVFRWQGQVDYAAESLLLVKTVAENYPEIENLINSLHG